MTTKLIPVDLKQCQATSRELPSAKNMMQIGFRSEWVRCTAKPTVVIKERKPGKDGKRGSMSLCAFCLKMFEQSPQAGTVTVAKIKAKAKKTTRTTVRLPKDKTTRQVFEAERDRILKDRRRS